MSNEITSTAEIDEREWDGHSEPSDVASDIVATKTAEGRGIEFHVSMRDYTQRDMEGLIIEAAAALIVGEHNEREIAKAIQAQCITLVNAKATAALESVTAEIIDQPMTPSFGDKKPVTMREFLSLYGREFLVAKVDGQGKPDPNNNSYYTKTRIEYLVGRHMDAVFQRDIEKLTSAAINEIRAKIEARHKETLEAEKKRFLDALAKTTAVQ